MILYHGSNVSFTEIDLEKGLPAKDFGRAANAVQGIVHAVFVPYGTGFVGSSV